MSAESFLLEQFYSLNSRIAAGGVYWTQGQGSNISVKSGNKLWIKASGFRLDEVTPSRGTVCVPLDSLKSDILKLLKSDLRADEKEQRYADSLKKSASDDTTGHRPSMETGFHALISSSFVAHFHSLAAIILCQVLKSLETRDRAHKCIMDSGYKTLPLVIPQVKPGLTLASYFVSGGTSDFILIENHGVILHGSDAQAMLDQWTRLEVLFFESGLIQLPKAPEENETPLLESLEPLFPDFAVFVDRIAEHSAHLQKDGQCRWVAKESLLEHQNFIELWQAQWMLAKARPQVANFDSFLCAELRLLPTEKFRRQ